MKTYEDLVGDGGSDIIGQVTQLGEKLRSRLDKIKHKVALMSGKGVWEKVPSLPIWLHALQTVAIKSEYWMQI